MCRQGGLSTSSDILPMERLALLSGVVVLGQPGSDGQ